MSRLVVQRGDRRRFRRRHAAAGALIWATLSLLTTVSPVAAADFLIDDFRDTVRLSLPKGARLTAVGTAMIVDGPAVDGVVGGTRRLAVTADQLALAGFDSITLGLVRRQTALSYASSTGADGRLSLRYDRNGAGLNTSFSAFSGLAIQMTAIDRAAVPMTVSLTISDGGATRTRIQTISQSGAQTITFALSGLGGLQLARIQSIELSFDPNRSGDLQIGAIRMTRMPAGAR